MVFPGLINDLPPIVFSSISLSRLGAQVVICSAGCSALTKEYLESENVKLHSLGINLYPKGLLGKLIIRISFLSLLKRLLRLLEIDFFWLHGAHGMRYLQLCPKGAKIVTHAHELYSSGSYKRTQDKAINAADVLIVPEENRKLILKAGSHSSAQTFIVPNRMLENLPTFATGNDTKNIFISHGGSANCTKFLIYQGLISKERCLLQLINGFINVSDVNIGLIILGGGTDIVYLNKIKKMASIDSRIVFVEKIPHPGHLRITSGCFAGILLYAPSCLNNIYCAPNKIYEYTSYGLAMVVPDFPGMKYLIEKFDLGSACDPYDQVSITSAIENIITRNPDYNKKCAKLFLESTKTVEMEYSFVFNYLNKLLVL
jgi:glycosyltransferase involved in cell wall biosynthesis